MGEKSDRKMNDDKSAEILQIVSSNFSAEFQHMLIWLMTEATQGDRYSIASGYVISELLNLQKESCSLGFST